MSYMVLECHPGYAVVMDEDGRFLKVANRKYTVGQTLTEVVQMQIPQERKKQKWLTPLLTMAACLALVLGITLPRSHQPYASVYVKINPEVRIDVDRQDMVVGLEGVNDDGAALIANYAYQNKHLDVVTDELVDKAIDEGYLKPDGQITISLDSQDQTWMDNHSQALSDHLQTHLQERIVVTIEIKLCTHEHPGEAHHSAWENGETQGQPEETHHIESQPSLDLDDMDDRDDYDDDHDDYDDDHDDYDDDHDDYDDDHDDHDDHDDDHDDHDDNHDWDEPADDDDDDEDRDEPDDDDDDDDDRDEPDDDDD